MAVRVCTTLPYLLNRPRQESSYSCRHHGVSSLLGCLGGSRPSSTSKSTTRTRSNPSARNSSYSAAPAAALAAKQGRSPTTGTASHSILPPLPQRACVTSSTTRTPWTRPNGSRKQSASPSPEEEMIEVEVKLRLPDASAHQRLSDALAGRHQQTHLQENVFFDGANAELTSQIAILRLRFYGGDSRCVVSLKARPQISGGISRVEEDEEDVEPAAARACVAEPWRLSSLASVGTGEPSRIMKRVAEEFAVDGEAPKMVCLGRFRNVRAVYGWDEEGLTLELDETQYDFGTSYELECETAEPDRAKELLEGFLKENEIPYSFSTVSKFAVFRAGKLIP